MQVSLISLFLVFSVVEFGTFSINQQEKGSSSSVNMLSNLINIRLMGKRGRQTTFSQRIANQISLLLAEGKSLRQIAKEEDMPSPPTIIRWTQDEDKKAFAEQYRVARQIGWEVRADGLLELPDDIVTEYRDSEGNNRIDGGSVQLARLKCQNMMWVLARLLPKKYGDKIESEIEAPQGLKRYTVEVIPKANEPQAEKTYDAINRIIISEPKPARFDENDLV